MLKKKKQLKIAIFLGVILFLINVQWYYAAEIIPDWSKGNGLRFIQYDLNGGSYEEKIENPNGYAIIPDGTYAMNFHIPNVICNSNRQNVEFKYSNDDSSVRTEEYYAQTKTIYFNRKYIDSSDVYAPFEIRVGPRDQDDKSKVEEGKRPDFRGLIYSRNATITSDSALDTLFIFERYKNTPYYFIKLLDGRYLSVDKNLMKQGDKYSHLSCYGTYRGSLFYLDKKYYADYKEEPVSYQLKVKDYPDYCLATRNLIRHKDELNRNSFYLNTTEACFYKSSELVDIYKNDMLKEYRENPFTLDISFNGTWSLTQDSHLKNADGYAIQTYRDLNHRFWLGWTEISKYNYFTSFHIPQKLGWEFREWNTKADGTGIGCNPGEPFTFQDLFEKDGSNKPQVSTIYAIYDRVKYAVNYDANGGTGTMKGQSLNSYENVTLAENAFTRKGYKFIGWSREKYAKKPKWYTNDTYYNDVDDVTLYAQWQKIGTGFIQRPFLDLDMFYKTISIEGQNGTTYNQEKTDSSMAHIDSENNPGYFSVK